MSRPFAIVTGASSGMSAIANVTGAGVLAKQHRKMAEPGSGQTANE